MEVGHEDEVDVADEISHCRDQQDASPAMTIRVLRVIQILRRG